MSSWERAKTRAVQGDKRHDNNLIYPIVIICGVLFLSRSTRSTLSLSSQLPVHPQPLRLHKIDRGPEEREFDESAAESEFQPSTRNEGIIQGMHSGFKLYEIDASNL